MTKLNEIYKCEVCGNIVEVNHAGAGKLVCCNAEMTEMQENTVDAATEKHVPVIDANTVKVGDVNHPMDKDHYIEWIQATSATGMICKKFLEPGDQPSVTFEFVVESARAYCNLHGLWKSS